MRMLVRNPILCSVAALSLLAAVATFDAVHQGRRELRAARFEQESLRGFGTLLPSGGDTPASALTAAGGDDGIRELVRRMSVADKIGQMTQLDVTSIVEDGTLLSLNATAAREHAALGVGSFLNSPASGGKRAGQSSPSSDAWRVFLHDLDQVYRKAGKVPPIFGIDSMHGANYVRDAILFPHAINIAASFNLANAYKSGRATAQSTRNAGIPWVFAPVLDVGMAPRFPRIYETYGEDPWLVASMGSAVLQGLQGQPFTQTSVKGGGKRFDVPRDLSSPDVVAACMKHFAGYMASRSGYDRGHPWIPETYLRSYFLPPFAAAVRAGVASAMTSYTSADGLPITLSRKWTRRWLRQEAGFRGMLVSDWLVLYNVITDHHAAATGAEAVQLSLNRSSTDMAMVPGRGADFIADLGADVASGRVPIERLDEAVTRILELKARLGLLADQVEGAPRKTPVAQLSHLPVSVRAQQAADSLRAACQSITLVKNRADALPLDLSDPATVLAVVGPNAESRCNLLGGWSVHWQGPVDDSEVKHVLTVAEGMRRVGNASIVSAVGVTVDGDAAGDDPVHVAEQATVGVMFVYGEGVYAEVNGDRSTSYLPAAQLELAQKLRSVCTRTQVPLVGVFVGGRDRLLTQIDDLLDAHLIAFYPGPFGGEAVASVVSGALVPSGRLPITLHRDDSQNLPYWQFHIDYLRHLGNRPPITPLYPFGHGLSYVRFDVADLEVDVVRASGASAAAPRPPGPGQDAPNDVVADLSFGDRVLVHVTVSNRGARHASTAVLLFLSDDFRIAPPEVKLLRAAARVALAAGESVRVEFELVMDDFGFEASDDVIDLPGRMIQPGTFTLRVEHLSTRIRVLGDPLDEATWPRLSTYVK